jgi:hypothetical protein
MAKGSVQPAGGDWPVQAGDNATATKKRSRSCAVWSTRQMNSDDTCPRSRARTTLRELGIYLLYIVITCILGFSMVSSVTYRYTSALKAVLEESRIRPLTNDYEEFVDISTADDVWDWMENPMHNTLFPTTHYNGQPLTDYERGFVLEDSKLLGLPRIRMLKVVNGSCDVPEDFRNDIYGCFGKYQPDQEDKNRQFLTSIYANATDILYSNETAWTYSDQAELDGTPYDGIVSTYSGGGNYQLLSRDSGTAKEIIQELKAGRWVTEGTRVMFVDFTVYNANINLFCVVKYVFEFPAAGGVIATTKFMTMRLIRYVDDYDYFVLSCEIIFCLFILYYTVEEVLEIRHMGFYKYATNSIWSVLDILILVFSYVAVLFNLYRYTTVANKLPGLIANEDDYANFDNLAYWQEQYNLLIALTLFLSWIKIFKYLSFNRTMTQMSQTLSQCAHDILGYTVMFFIVFFSYAQLGYLVFGSNTFGFHTFEDSVFTLFRIILGDFDFYALKQSHRVFGPIYFITYVFFVFFILINVFLAIINDSYTKVKEDLDRGEKSFEVAEYLSHMFGKAFRKKRNDVEGAGEKADGAAKGTELAFDDQGLQARANQADTSGEPNASEQKGLQSRRGGGAEKGLDADQAAVGGANSADVAKINKRVDRLEQAMGSTIAKIDAILVHLENIEFAQRVAAGFEDDAGTEAEA